MRKKRTSDIAELIFRVKSVRKRLADAVREEKRICTPVLSDFNLVGRVHSVFLAKMNEMDAGKKRYGDYRRMQFLMLVKVLFAPRSLYGADFPKGLRLPVSKVMNINKSRVSQLSAGTARMYELNLYGFADDFDCIYRHVLSEVSKWER